MDIIQPGPLLVSTKTSLQEFVQISDHRYSVKIADNLDEIDAALRLRYTIFNLELNEGFSRSYYTQKDEDEFDAQFHHLIVVEKSSGEIVGTYRIQTYEMARSGNGFYSAGEFEIKKLGRFRLIRSVELGRACISEHHRNGRVLFLLWKGIGQYMQIHQKRFLFGCCSLSSQESVEGPLLMNHLMQQGKVHKSLFINPLPAYKCYISAIKDLDLDLDGPPLMEIYFRYGAKVCSYPAMDRDFRTIDFLVLLDMNDLDMEIRSLFLN